MLALLAGGSRPTPQGVIAVTDPKVQEKIRFARLTHEDLGEVAKWRSVVMGQIDAIVDEFYAHIARFPAAQAIVTRHTTVERQRGPFTRYIATLFDGKVDDSWVAARTHLGQLHERINLSMSHYSPMFEIIRTHASGAVRKSGGVRETLRFREAFERVVTLDMALVMDALLDARMEKVKQAQGEADRARQAADAFFSELAPVLDAAAARDLSVRVPADRFEGRYQQIGRQVNETLRQISAGWRQVADSSKSVASASNEITAASQSLADASIQQSASIDAVTQQLSEITSVTRENASAAEVTGHALHDARDRAEQGAEGVRRLSAAMTAIAQSSDKTAEIVKTIDEIAFQTNLLALNAAVEAARAGSSGRGFAVVAEEVRRLAARSAEAARSSAQLIEESVARTKEGVALQHEVTASFNDISRKVGEVAEQVDAIVQGSRQQTDAVDLIQANVEEISRSTSHNAATSEESASSAEHLDASARQLAQMVAAYRL